MCTKGIQGVRNASPGRARSLVQTTMLAVLAGVLLLFTQNQARAQTLSISHDTSVIPPRALDALTMDPFGVHADVSNVSQRMNVGVAVKLSAVASGVLTNVQWSISGPARIEDYTIMSDRSTGAGYRTECTTEALSASDLQLSSITFHYVEEGMSVVTLNAMVDGVPLVDSQTFVVRRNPKVEIFYITGPGVTAFSDPGQNRADLLAEHSWWHQGVEDVSPAGEFFRFHRGYIQKVNCWRAIFGYPSVKVYVPSPDYVPGTADPVTDECPPS